MFISRHTLKWTKTCRSSGDFPHAHTAHFLLNRHIYADRAGREWWARSLPQGHRRRRKARGGSVARIRIPGQDARPREASWAVRPFPVRRVGGRRRYRSERRPTRRGREAHAFPHGAHRARQDRRRERRDADRHVPSADRGRADDSAWSRISPTRTTTCRLSWTRSTTVPCGVLGHRALAKAFTDELLELTNEQGRYTSKLTSGLAFMRYALRNARFWFGSHCYAWLVLLPQYDV